MFYVGISLPQYYFDLNRNNILCWRAFFPSCCAIYDWFFMFYTFYWTIYFFCRFPVPHTLCFMYVWCSFCYFLFILPQYFQLLLCSNEYFLVILPFIVYDEKKSLFLLYAKSVFLRLVHMHSVRFGFFINCMLRIRNTKKNVSRPFPSTVLKKLTIDWARNQICMYTLLCVVYNLWRILFGVCLCQSVEWLGLSSLFSKTYWQTPGQSLARPLAMLFVPHTVISYRYL